MKVLYPGSFDPITIGHLDVIEKIGMMFGKVTIVVAQSEHKNYMFSHTERIEMVKQATNDLLYVDVVGWESMMGTLIENEWDKITEHLFNDEPTKNDNPNVLIARGLRDNVDFHDEMMYEQYTQGYGATTFYVTPEPKNIFVSSSLVRAHLQTGSIPIDHVPNQIIPYLRPQETD